LFQLLKLGWEDCGMPDKQNDNKFMAMLERRGIVKKSGDEGAAADTGVPHTNPEAELRTLLIPPTDDSVNVTPAARQPIPGLSNPSLPGERPSQVERELREREQRPVPSLVPMDYSMSAKPESLDEWQESAQSEQSGQAVSADTPDELEEPSAPSRFYSNITSVDPFKDESVPDLAPFSVSIGSVASAPPQEFPPEPLQVLTPEPPTADSYTDRYLDINELYNVLSLETNRKDTIYLIEEYLKTLPESLPDESRRDIVEKIVTASGFDYDLLMGDGVLRVKMLKDYAGRFAQYTDDYVAARNAELNELEQQSMRIRRLIENRRDLHKKQFFAIEAEAQRLKDILTFISG